MRSVQGAGASTGFAWVRLMEDWWKKAPDDQLPQECCWPAGAELILSPLVERQCNKDTRDCQLPELLPYVNIVDPLTLYAIC